MLTGNPSKRLARLEERAAFKASPTCFLLVVPKRRPEAPRCADWRGKPFRQFLLGETSKTGLPLPRDWLLLSSDAYGKLPSWCLRIAQVAVIK
ncbi:hypothetical protein [Nostoc sp.]|uniref:hypothetical protein n=1 Tax=Nostoc sp. TaxID=1180 RepID=UPI002FFC7787